MCDIEDTRRKYKYVPPNGGWGYIILLSVAVFHLTTVIPNITFGLIYGKFLASIGDETSQTALISGIYFTAQMFSGFFTNFLLRKYTYRKVGLAGAIFYILGTVSAIFVENLFHMIICFGLLQGIGIGFMMGAVFCSFNSYFTTRLNLMNGIVQTIDVIGVTAIPLFIAHLIENLGFRYTLIVVAALATINLISTAALEPVNRHMKRLPVDNDEDLIEDECDQKNTSYNELERVQGRPLLQSNKNDNKLGNFEAKIHASLENLGEKMRYVRPRKTDEPRDVSFIDVDLLKCPTFWNISFGVSLTFLADASFCALIPVLLGTIGFETSNIAFMMTVSFGCDLAGRLLYAVCCIFLKPRNNYIFLIGSAAMAIFRLVFTLHNSYIWRLVTLAFIGAVRCLIASTLILVISDEYKERFPSAFPLSMVVSGITALIYGGLGSLVKTLTGNDVMVVYLLTIGNLLCVFCWSTEFIYRRLKHRTSERLQG